MTLSSNEVWDVIFLLLLARSTAQKLFRHLSSSSSSHNKFNNNAFYAHCVRTSLLLRNNNRLYNLLSRHKSLSLAALSRQQFCWVEHILSSQFKISLVHQLSLLWLHEHITYTYWSDYLILYILNVRHGNERGSVGWPHVCYNRSFCCLHFVCN